MADLELSDYENERMSVAGDRENRDSDNDRGARSDEAEEESAGKNNDDEEEDESKGRRIDPSTSRKRSSKNPQPKLNAERIQGPKGVQTLEKYFDGFKFHGKGHEKTDLDRVMKRMEHWGHRLFPKYGFDDFLEKMENLGTKKNVQVFIKKYRLGMIGPDDDNINEVDDNTAEREDELVPEETPIDEFDKLIAEQIEKQRQVVSDKVNETSNESLTRGHVLGTAKTPELSDEIKARIEANRKLALERKMAREKRMEEEQKRQKLEDSLANSQVTLSDSQLVDKVPNELEKAEDNGQNLREIFAGKETSAANSQVVKKDRLEKVKQNGKCTREFVEAKEMDVPNSEIFEDVPNKLEKSEEDGQHSGRIFALEETSVANSLVVKKVSDRLEKVKQNGKCTGEFVEAKKMDVPNSEIFEDVSDGLEKGEDNVEHPEGIFEAMEISNEKIEENMKKKIDTSEELLQIQEETGTSTITEAIEDVPDGTEDIDLPLSQNRNFEEPQNNNERLLTNEELLMEISGAVEEIISRGERQRNEHQGNDRENTRWNGIYKCASESE